MRSLFGLTMLSILLLTGCKEEPPPEAVPVEVPPKTVQDRKKAVAAKSRAGRQTFARVKKPVMEALRRIG